LTIVRAIPPVKYEQSLWKGAGKAQMDLVAQRKLTKWDHMTTSERIKDWSMWVEVEAL
jgi:hypothetical protein